MDDKIKKIENIILDATKNNATEIHFHPEVDTVSVYYRDNNKLSKKDTLSLEEYNKCLRFMKIKTSLDPSDTKRPHDAMFVMQLEEGINIKNRISTLPLLDHEILLIKILDDRRQPKFNEIAHSPEDLGIIYDEIKNKQGIFILGGNSKENKSAVINSIADKLCTEQNLKVVTLEKDIKIINENFIQIQVNEDMGLNYHKALEVARRQQPDIIIIDKIRDEQTVTIAFHAAFRGYKVITTMENQSNLNTVEKLLEYGLLSREIDNYVIGISNQKTKLNEYGEKRTHFNYLVDTNLSKFIKSNEQYIINKLNISQNIKEIVTEVEKQNKNAANHISTLNLDEAIDSKILFSNEEITKENTIKMITELLDQQLPKSQENFEALYILNKIQNIKNTSEIKHQEPPR